MLEFAKTEVGFGLPPEEKEEKENKCSERPVRGWSTDMKIRKERNSPRGLVSHASLVTGGGCGRDRGARRSFILIAPFYALHKAASWPRGGPTDLVHRLFFSVPFCFVHAEEITLSVSATSNYANSLKFEIVCLLSLKSHCTIQFYGFKVNIFTCNNLQY